MESAAQWVFALKKAIKIHCSLLEKKQQKKTEQFLSQPSQRTNAKKSLRIQLGILS